MRSRVSALLLCGVVAVARAADASFSSTLNPGEFAAAGLGKLSPAELAKLDELIKATKSPAAIAAVPATDRRQVSADGTVVLSPATGTTTVATREIPAPSAPPTAKAGFFERAKVLLTPGTEVEYTTLDSMLMPPFQGWEKGTVLTLENGQRWQVIDGHYASPIVKAPVKVRIVPGAIGSFFMEIDGGGRPKVKLVSHAP